MPQSENYFDLSAWLEYIYSDDVTFRGGDVIRCVPSAGPAGVTSLWAQGVGCGAGPWVRLSSVVRRGCEVSVSRWR